MAHSKVVNSARSMVGKSAAVMADATVEKLGWIVVAMMVVMMVAS